MIPDERLEAGLREALTVQPPAARLAALDRRIEQLAAGSTTPAPGRLRRAMSTANALGATVLAVGILGIAILNVPGAAGPASPTPSDAVAATSEGPTGSLPTAGPPEFSGAPPSPLTATPTAGPTLEVTPAPDPTPPPSTAPTARPTPPPSNAPTAPPTAVPDPEPEGTPQTYSASGSFGQTLTIEGVAVTMDRIPTPAALATSCDYAARETWAYTFRMSWTNPPASTEPWIALGAHPHNVVSFEPAWAVNEDITVILCHEPGDTERVLVESSPPGSPIIYYRWSFT